MQSRELSGLTSLSEELLLQIFSTLDVKSIANTMLVCKLFNFIGSDSQVWKIKCQELSDKKDELDRALEEHNKFSETVNFNYQFFYKVHKETCFIVVGPFRSLNKNNLTKSLQEQAQKNIFLMLYTEKSHAEEFAARHSNQQDQYHVVKVKRTNLPLIKWHFGNNDEPCFRIDSSSLKQKDVMDTLLNNVMESFMMVEPAKRCVIS